MSEDRVCAVVVTYNRKELLMECLDALKNQSRSLDAIYLIDNASADGTSELLLEQGYIGELPPSTSENWEILKILSSNHHKNINFHYVRMSDNTGGAGGFYEGVKRAYHGGYDWLWLMDDDSEPLIDAIEKLADYFDEENISALAGIVKTPENTYTPGHRGFSDFNSFFNYYLARPIETEPELFENHKVLNIDDASFVGVLVNRKSVSKIGFPKKDLFVYRDDTEYSIRLRSVGRILLVTDSIILHKDYKSSKLLKKSFLGHTFFRVKYENFWLSYYAIRNNIWLLKLYRRPLVFLWIMLVGSWLASISAIIVFDDNKLKRMQFVTSAYMDGLKENFENEKPKKILYS